MIDNIEKAMTSTKDYVNKAKDNTSNALSNQRAARKVNAL